MTQEMKNVEFSHSDDGEDFTEAWQLRGAGSAFHFEAIQFSGKSRDDYWTKYNSWVADVREGRQPTPPGNDHFRIERRIGEGSISDAAAFFLNGRDKDRAWRSRVWNALRHFDGECQSLEEMLRQEA